MLLRGLDWLPGKSDCGNRRATVFQRLSMARHQAFANLPMIGFTLRLTKLVAAGTAGKAEIHYAASGVKWLLRAPANEILVTD